MGGNGTGYSSNRLDVIGIIKKQIKWIIEHITSINIVVDTKIDKVSIGSGNIAEITTDGGIQSSGITSQQISDALGNNLIEDAQNGEKIGVLLRFPFGYSIPTINDGYMTFSSSQSKYCIWHGFNPELVGYTHIPLMDLISFNEGAQMPIIPNTIETPIHLEFDIEGILINYHGAMPGIKIISKKQESSIEESSLWISQGGNNNPNVYSISNGLLSNVQPTEGRQFRIKDVEDLNDRLLDYIPEFYLKISKNDIVWSNYGYIQITHSESLELNRKIKNVTLRADFGNGTIQLTPVFKYPCASTYNGSLFQGFYIKDFEGKLRQDADFSFLEVLYDVEVEPLGTTFTYRYDSLKPNFGDNIISDHPANQSSHADYLRGLFNTLYDDFTNQYIDSYSDPVAGFRNVPQKFLPKYAELKDASLIYRPMGDGARYRNQGSNANIMSVAAHYNNTFTRYNITSAEDIFLENVIAVNSCSLTETPASGTCTSYGFGVEFTEDLTTLHLTFPVFDISWINPIYQESTASLVVAIKIHKIKKATGANWAVVREACRATASNNGSWDMYRGFGQINMPAAIAYINGAYINNVARRGQMAEEFDFQRGLPPFLQYSDLLPNSPISKKMLEEHGGGGGYSDVVNYITGGTSGAIYDILKGMNVITNCLAEGTHIFSLPIPIEGVENLMTVKFRTCSTTIPTITREIPKLQGVGTISNDANSPILTGVGTAFTELRSGDKIYFDWAEREILTVDSDTQITLVNDVVGAYTDESWEYCIPVRIFGGVEPVWGISEIRAIFYEYVKYGNTWYLEISYSQNAN